MARISGGVSAALVPFGRDLDPALTIAKEALFASRPPGEDPTEFWPGLEDRIRGGETNGALWVRSGSTLGVAVWSPPGPLGVAVGILYLRGTEASPDGYRALFTSVEAHAGPVAFAPSPLAGLAPAAESRLMRELGFAPYARSEMTVPLTETAARTPLPSGRRARPYRPDDAPEVARVHEKAFAGRFDRYLFLNDLDPARDAEILVRDLVGGRWGEFLPEASIVVEEDGRTVGSVLVIRTPRGPLIADVAADPAFAGRGIGRTALEESLRALRDLGERRARLAVTEGNQRALALYEKLGFVRNLGPTTEWYRTARIPVPPGSD
jgi:ribosomal protein S18 acetylase RimI-like enzyme